VHHHSLPKQLHRDVWTLADLHCFHCKPVSI